MTASRRSFARSSRLRAWLLVAVAACGCSKGSPSPTTSSSDSPTPLSPSSASAPTAPAASTAPTPEVADASHGDYATAAPLAGKAIGHTSVVFKLKLEGGLEAAFKPRSHRGKTRYRGEIATYRLALALGLRNVPRAMGRSFPRVALQSVLDPTARDLLDREAIADPDGNVAGALIPWIPKLELLPLENAEWSARWTGWLGGAGSLPDDQRALAAQISTMIVLDYLTANWDRWSGGQIGIDRASGTLLFLDNDGTFFDPPPAGSLATQLARLTKVSRFSRAFVNAVRGLDPNAARTAIGEEIPGVALLTPHVLAGLEERRKAVLAVIDAKIAEHGEQAVLVFE